MKNKNNRIRDKLPIFEKPKGKYVLKKNEVAQAIRQARFFCDFIRKGVLKVGLTQQNSA
jgi:hypothetical protein